MANLPNIPSPCVGVCALDPATGLCQGCMRTTGEIGEWGGASNERRYEIVMALRERRIAAGRVSDSDLRPRRRRRARSAIS
jgi:predicted Fe-S protein YdhL (DUF1289 family)